MATHEIWLSTDSGTRLHPIETYTSLEYVLLTHDVGACNIVLPSNFDTSLLAAHRRIEIARAPFGVNPTLQDAYLITKVIDQTDAESGLRTIQVIGANGLWLPGGRVVAYNAGSSQATKTDQADDMMKAVIRENIGASAAAARQVSSSYLSVQADAGAGPSISKDMAWQNVLRVCQELADAAWAAGTKVYFGMIPVSAGSWEFRTRTGQLGQDHTVTSGVSPVELSIEKENLRNVRLELDYSDEVSVVYAKGQTGDTTAEDTTRSGRSAFGRREAYLNATGESTANGLTAAANSRLAAGRPKLRFSASIKENASTRYGVEWGWGDRLTATYQGQSYDVVVRMVRVTVDKNGRETIDARVEVEE